MVSCHYSLSPTRRFERECFSLLMSRSDNLLQIAFVCEYQVADFNFLYRSISMFGKNHSSCRETGTPTDHKVYMTQSLYLLFGDFRYITKVRNIWIVVLQNLGRELYVVAGFILGERHRCPTKWLPCDSSGLYA